MIAFAAVSPADAAIDPSAAFSLAFIGGPLPGRVNGGQRGRQCALVPFMSAVDFSPPKR